MNKLMMTVAVAALSLAALAQECDKPCCKDQGPKEGPKCEMRGPEMHGPKPVELVLCPRTMTPEAVDAFKKDVMARIDEAVGKTLEMKAKMEQEGPKPECKGPKPEARKLVLLEVGGHGPRPEMHGPKGHGPKGHGHEGRPEMHGPEGK